MTIEKVFPSGAYRVSDIIRGHLVMRTYYGYTKSEARRMFRKEISNA